MGSTTCSRHAPPSATPGWAGLASSEGLPDWLLERESCCWMVSAKTMLCIARVSVSLGRCLTCITRSWTKSCSRMRSIRLTNCTSSSSSCRRVCLYITCRVWSVCSLRTSSSRPRLRQFLKSPSMYAQSSRVMRFWEIHASSCLSKCRAFLDPLAMSTTGLNSVVTISTSSTRSSSNWCCQAHRTRLLSRRARISFSFSFIHLFRLSTRCPMDPPTSAPKMAELAMPTGPKGRAKRPSTVLPMIAPRLLALW
mmetsp:Transcript_76751/g.217083  ORF Transcript_76751/g.217083 Transcript_76751/m.217083 type:complete len:252 (+) Transcript_76751:1000-1755(+)